MMVSLSCPSMLFASLTTIPALLFHSPEYHRYFYFWKGMEQDPLRWVALFLAAACTFLALAVPVVAETRRSEDDLSEPVEA